MLHSYFLFGAEPIDAEVVGFKDGKTLLMPLGDLRGVGIGSKIVSKKQAVNTVVGDNLLGRVIDGLGNQWMARGQSTAESLFLFTVTP